MIKTIHKISGAVLAISMILAWGIAGNIDCGGNNIGAFVAAAAAIALSGIAFIATQEDD